jgi:hypothetical protein
LRIPEYNGFQFTWIADASIISVCERECSTMRAGNTQNCTRENDRKIVRLSMPSGKWLVHPHGKPYYRVMLLLNHAAYHVQSTGFDPANTLQYRARSSLDQGNAQIPQEFFGGLHSLSTKRFNDD